MSSKLTLSPEITDLGISSSKRKQFIQTTSPTIENERMSQETTTGSTEIKKRGRGRPRKNPIPETSLQIHQTQTITSPDIIKNEEKIKTENPEMPKKRGRGRPRIKPPAEVKKAMEEVHMDVYEKRDDISSSHENTNLSFKYESSQDSQDSQETQGSFSFEEESKIDPLEVKPNEMVQQDNSEKTSWDQMEITTPDRESQSSQTSQYSSSPSLLIKNCSMEMPSDDSVVVGISSIFGSSERKYDSNFIPGLDLCSETEQVSESMTHSMAALQIKKILDLEHQQDKERDKELKKEKEIKEKAEEEKKKKENEETKIRRSSRIKTLEETRPIKRRGVEYFNMEDPSLSRSMPSLSMNEDDSNSESQTSLPGSSSASPPRDSNNSSFMGTGTGAAFGSLPSFSSGSSSDVVGTTKPYKVKSRWRFSADAESFKSIMDPNNSKLSSPDNAKTPQSTFNFDPSIKRIQMPGNLFFDETDKELQEKLKKFEGIEENVFKSRKRELAKGDWMECDCFLTKEEISRGEMGCKDNCLNRMVMVECGSRCTLGDRCANKMFQRKKYSKLEVFKTEKKGHGLRVMHPLKAGGFVVEYLGEVIDTREFDKRRDLYAKQNIEHFYFMSLRVDAIIDASMKGNCSRFINHSCEPNCETQKWTVDGEVRIGFFAIKDLQVGDEITFDYQFERYGKAAQKCYCQTDSCTGWIGGIDDEYEGDKDETNERIVSKPRKEKKRKDTHQQRILEDKSLKEDLLKLEFTGMKNKNHTVTLVRLMIRAEDWDLREKILRILIQGDTPCRRLFLDYHGLKHLYNWMKDLPLPIDSEDPQIIRNDEYHILFLNVLSSLPIPNKTLLQESKILALIEGWSLSPSKTCELEIIKKIKSPIEEIKKEETEIKTDEIKSEENLIKEDEIKPEAESMDLTENEGAKEDVSQQNTESSSSEIIQSNESTEKQEDNDKEEQEIKKHEHNWYFVSLAKEVLDSWELLKEVFRIPKKERVEQRKEHETEADQGEDEEEEDERRRSYYADNSRGSDKNRFQKIERRTSSSDYPERTTGSYGRGKIIPRLPFSRSVNLTKEEKRHIFEQQIKQQAEAERQKKLQEEIFEMHRERCATFNFDLTTTPIIDANCLYYLNPKTINWVKIDPEDPTIPKDVLLLADAIRMQQQQQQQPQAMEVESSQQNFFDFLNHKWPQGLLPPPPLPPLELKRGWKMVVQDDLRVYYYNIKTKETTWYPPEEDYIDDEEEEEEDEEGEDESEFVETDEINSDDEPALILTKINELHKTRLDERRERRKKSGLVQEKIISPRSEEEKSTVTKKQIHETKLEVLEEKKLAKLQAKQQMKMTPISAESLEPKVMAEGESNAPTVEDMKPPVEDDLLSIVKENKIRTTSPSASASAAVDKGEKPADIKLKPRSKKAKSSNRKDDKAVKKHVSLKMKKKMHHKAKASKSTEEIPGLGLSKNVLIKSEAEKERKRKKMEENFRNKIAKIIVETLNPFRREDCKNGRITTTEHFKHLARKMTKTISDKEMKNVHFDKEVEISDNVKLKIKAYVKKYMARFPDMSYCPSPPQNNPESEEISFNISNISASEPL